MISEPSKHGISKDFSAVAALSIFEQSGTIPSVVVF
jgi:hypothetical protein